jgi:nucleotide-binding universal stress UspA family protein
MKAPILVPLDGSPLAEQALEHAASLAGLLEAPILLTRVPEPLIVPVMSAGIWITHEVETAEARAQAEAYLAEVAARPVFAGIEVTQRIAHSPVPAGLLELMQEVSPRLVVMSTHGRSGLQRVVLGSVADKLLRSANCSVYLLPAAAPAESTLPERILLPLDGSALAETAIAHARDLALAAGAELILCRVPTLPGYSTVVPENAAMIPALLREESLRVEAYLADRVAALRAEGVDARGQVALVEAGTVVEGLIDAADSLDVDLIMLCSHGRSGIGRWLFGSVADGLVRQARRPVWLVKPTGD